MTVTVSPIRSIAAEALEARLGEPSLVVVDTRPLAAYNGWGLGATRGGHIPGAIAIPAEWLPRLDGPELDSLLATHRLDASRTIVVYGDDEASTEAVAGRLQDAGLTVERLEGGWTTWTAESARPTESLPRFERLVHPEWLLEVLSGGRPEAAPAGDSLLFHVNFGVPEEYAENHLPNALYLDTNWLEDPADWNRRSPAELEDAVRRLGITSTTTVILYGRDTEGAANEKWPGRRAGQIAATRAALILRYAGVEDVRLLDGGYDRWVQRGYPLETVPRQPTPVASFGVSIPAHPELIVDIDEAKEIIADPAGAALVSVRTWREHIGSVSGYNYIGAAGRIAGDVWGNCGTDAYHMQHYRAVDNTMRPYPEIVANWAEAGITADKRLAFYCGTGWRASETWFYADLLGWPTIAVYDGGWFEWSQDPINNPIEIGDPTAAGSEVAA
ncbi:MAG TPA: rhodanese-like domain-containing protein [Candidatus Limnocylindrales bacterium]